MILPLITVLVVILDRISKICIQYYFSPGDSIRIIDEAVYITYVRNPGSLFGIFPDKAFLFIPLSIAAAVAILFYYYRFRPGKLVSFGLGLELGGALGNLIDRLISGQVTDFIDLRIWPIFNLADSAISVGLIIIVWGLIRELKREARNT